MPGGLLLATLLATGCAGHRAPPPAKTAVPAPAPTTAQGRAGEPRVGTVRAIGAHGRFVLVEVPSFLAAGLLPPGQPLHCHADGAGPLSTADLRATREREQAFVAADVLAGEPHVGDGVFLAAGGEPPSAPAPAVPISSVLPPLLPGPSPAPTP